MRGGGDAVECRPRRFLPANILEGFRPEDSRDLGDDLKVTFYERAR